MGQLWVTATQGNGSAEPLAMLGRAWIRKNARNVDKSGSVSYLHPISSFCPKPRERHLHDRAGEHRGHL